jgi:hypothetical protein
MRKTLLVMAMVSALAMSTLGAAVASDAMLAPFTQDELDDNWVADRQYPSGGVNSVTFDGRDDVAKISIIGEEQDSDPFRQFEGIKKVDDFGLAVQVDLFVDSDWQSQSPVNVGFWASDDPISAYPLIVYRNSASVDAGFYTWDVVYDEGAGVWVGVYVPADTEVKYDDWNTLSMALDPDEGVVNYAINGDDVGSIDASGERIGQVFLNHYNAGDRNYEAYWHAGVAEPTSKDDCKNGRWEEFGFRNQGQCIQFVNTGRDSR